VWKLVSTRGGLTLYPSATRVILSVFADMTSRAETTRLVRYPRRGATYRLAAAIGEPSNSPRGSSRPLSGRNPPWSAERPWCAPNFRHQAD
jgi:hypothetical protein